MDELESNFTDGDFERAEEESAGQLEWIEDDGLIQVVRGDDNELDYEEDSDYAGDSDDS